MNFSSLLPSLLQRTTRATALLGPITLLVLLAPPTVKAASTTWTASSGQWNTEASWNNGLPTTSSTAVINNGSTISIPTSATGRYNELLTGITDGGGGGININGGLLSGTFAYLGQTAGGTGSATVTSGTWSNTFNLYVGYFGTGTLAINGGYVTNYEAFLGDKANSHGSATMTSGTWYHSGNLHVGYSGTGTLAITGGTISNFNGLIGRDATGHGSVTVTGGTWGNRGTLYAGLYGTGSLTINGGTVINTTGKLGIYRGSIGSATVTSGTWTNTSTFYVGEYGTGTLEINGGTVTNTNGFIGNGSELDGSLGGHGTVTVTSGTWNNSINLYVGGSGTGTLTVNGGTVTNSTGYLGFSTHGLGSVTVTSGTWSNSENLHVGSSGTGTLAVNGGIVHVSGTTFTSWNDTGNGKITLSGNEDHQGVLETRAVVKGWDSSTFGTAKVSFNGGIIRALADNDDFIQRFTEGDITINTGGAFVDTAEFTIGINAPLGGEGALHKLGIGTLTLGGTNTYTGGTVVEAGTLTAAHEDALGTGAVTVKSGGTFTIQSGVTVTNAIVLEGGSLNKTVAEGASLAGSITASTTLGKATSAELLDGIASAATSLQASFSATSSAENDGVRLGGVFHLTGLHVITPGTGETDQFVLQLQVAGVSDINFLGWFDAKTNQWVNAVEGNIGGEANFLGNKAYNAATDFQLGNYGFDTVNGTVWAVLNHNSEFAVVPEPGAWALLVLGAGAMLHRARKRRGKSL